MTHEISCSKTMFDMTENQKMVLLHIARYGPQHGYIISKTRLLPDGSVDKRSLIDRKAEPHIRSQQLSSSAVLYAIRQLKRAGLLKKTRKGMKGSKRRDIYRLTFSGLSLALFVELDKDVIYDVIDKWKKLDPVILGKWDHITKNIPKEEIGILLFTAMFKRFGYPEAIKSLVRDTIVVESIGLSFFEWLFKKGPPVSSGTKLQDIKVVKESRALTIFREFFFDEVFQKYDPLDDWIVTIRGDIKLRNWTVKYLRKRISTLERQEERLKSIASRLEKV